MGMDNWSSLIKPMLGLLSTNDNIIIIEFQESQI